MRRLTHEHFPSSVIMPEVRRIFPGVRRVLARFQAGGDAAGGHRHGEEELSGA